MMSSGSGVKIASVFSLGLIGAVAMFTGHDAGALNLIVSAILVISGMATAVQWRATGGGRL